MRDPIKAIQNAASVCKKHFIIETAVGLEHVAQPAMAYLPRTAGNEQSNYWRPNPPLVNLWLKELGFRKIDHRVPSDRDSLTPCADRPDVDLLPKLAQVRHAKG